MSNKSIYLNPDNVEGFEELTSVNVIVIKPFEYAATSFLNVKNSVVVLLQGKHFEQVAYEDIDNSANVGKFAIDTTNRLVLVVDNVAVTNIHEAKKYVWGIVVKYEKRPLKYMDEIPTYTVKTYTDNNILVSETIPTSLPDVMNKIKCLDKSLSLDDCKYYHILERSVI